MVTQKVSNMRYPSKLLFKTCEKCKKIFPRKTDVTYKQWDRARFCSLSCKAKSQFNGSNHPRWMGGKVEKECGICHSIFLVEGYRSKNSKFCSLRCKYKNQDTGINKIDYKIRRREIYKLWRMEIFQRDSYKCCLCNKKNGEGKTVVLNVDHYPKSFSQIIRDNNIKTMDEMLICDELWDINNGRTLCLECHKQTSTYGVKAWRNDTHREGLGY